MDTLTNQINGMKNQTMTSKDVKAIGNFLSNYYSDLLFIKEFRTQISNTEKAPEVYFDKDISGSFMNFLISYGINRNFTKADIYKGDIIKDLFYVIKKYILINLSNSEPKSDDVIRLVDVIKKAKDKDNNPITPHNLISLSSKTLFLYKAFYYPYDSQAKVSLNYNGNVYQEFHNKAGNYWKENKDNKKKIDFCLNEIAKYTDIIENNFNGFFDDIEEIRFNRFVDKMLWTIGE
ncbi:MAG: hypothetical protein PHN88_00390 [Ignavibacteria bacterium]|nr:hypothetical protein [Ignavibacteria bacterium]